MNGDKAAPLYKYLKSSKGGLFGDGIKWNFSKFLVDKEGNVVDRYAPTTSPLSIEVYMFPVNYKIKHFSKFSNFTHEIGSYHILVSCLNIVVMV